MNIKTVRDNLEKTIAGKKELIRQKYGNPAALDRLSEEDLLVWNMTAKFLRMSIAELEKILHDIDSCAKKDGVLSWSPLSELG